ncbi:MAG: translation elongation factor Ts [Pseudomonadota bacterium]|nr:translation elongation factor Ts [Pseudomonadota bacterium]
MASMEQIKDLRERTGAGILDCKKALGESSDDVEKAIDWLRAKGLSSAAKKSGRVASEGLVEAYIHAGGKIGVIVELNCETDFVAMNEKFKALARDVAMHIAAAAPEYLSRDEVPADAYEKEKAVQLEKTMSEGKPQHIAAKIVEGRMSKWYEDVCLLDQKYVKDDSKTIDQLVKETVSTIGENVKIRRFVRYVMGEGLEKKSNDFAAEVAAQAGITKA